MAADVLVPAQQVAVGAGVDGRLFIGLQGARQHQFFVGLFRRGMNDRHGGNGIDFRFLGQRMSGTNAAEHARGAAQHEHHHDQHDDDHCFARRRRRKFRRWRYLRRSVVRFLHRTDSFLVPSA